MDSACSRRRDESDAAVKAGYSEKTAMVKGAKLSKELGHIVNGQRAEEKRHVQKMAMVD